MTHTNSCLPSNKVENVRSFRLRKELGLTEKQIKALPDTYPAAGDDQHEWMIARIREVEDFLHRTPCVSDFELTARDMITEALHIQQKKGKRNNTARQLELVCHDHLLGLGIELFTQSNLVTRINECKRMG